MKKINRSQSSYRQCKTLLNDDDSDSFLGKYASKPLAKNVGIASSILDANKQNNSLFQSISERNFSGKQKERVSEFELSQDVNVRMEQKCKRLEQQLQKMYIQREEMIRNGSNSRMAPYYQREIESLKDIIKQKDCQLDFYKQEFSIKHEEMDSISSQVSSKMDKDQRDKNLYIKELNNKSIEISTLQEKLKIFKSEVDTLKFCLEEKEQTIREFQQKIGQTDMKKRKIQHYENQIKDSQEMLKELQAATLKLKEEKEEKESVIQDKVKKCSELELTLGSYQDKLRSIEDTVIKLTEERKNQKQRNEELSREREDWKQSYDQLLKQSQSLQEYEIKIKTYSSMLQDQTKKNMQLMSMNEKYKINSLSLQKNVSRYQEIEKDMINLKKTLKERDEKIIEFQTKERSYRHLEECYTKIRKEKDQFFIKIQEKNKEVKTLNTIIDQQKLKIVGLEQELDEILQNNSRNKDRGQKMDVLMKENNRLNANLLEKINEIEKLQIKMNNLENRVTEKHNDSLRMKSIVDQKEQIIDQIKLEVQDLRQRYQIETNNRISNEDKLLRSNQENYAQKCTISKLESQKEEMEEKIDQMNVSHQQQMEKVQEKLTEMETSKEQTQNMLNKCKEKSEMLMGEIEELKRQLQECLKKENNHKMQMMKIQAYIMQLKEEIIILRGEKNQIIQKCTQLKQIHDFVMEFRQLPDK